MQKPQLFNTVNRTLTDVVDSVRPEKLDTPMPSYASTKTASTLRDILNVFAYENLCVPKVLAGESGLTGNGDITEDYLGDDFLGTYHQHADAATAAVESYDDWQRTVHISYGDFTAESYITDITLNRAMGIFDIAGITGVKPELSPDAVQGVWDIAAKYAEGLREYGVFPPEVKVADDAPLIDRLQGLMGRQPL